MSLIKKIGGWIINRPIRNLFHKSFPKRVLIFYIVSPFRRGISYTHSNQLEAIKIAEIFDEFGYIVDLHNYDYPFTPNFLKYNVIFGMGPLFEKAVKNKKAGITYIYYATGSYFGFQNPSEIRRLINLYKRRGVLLAPKRIARHLYYATQFADAIITTGNDVTVSTYVYSEMPIYKVPISVYQIFDFNEIKRDVTKAKRNFLWFGSSGLVHKGLDLCLEVFKDLPQFNLHICGPKEEDFFKVYKKELNLPNIYYHGFVDIRSSKLKKIVLECMFVIFPSCSEGQSGSLLTAMSTGLIPIANKFVGVDIKDKGFLVDGNIEHIKKTVLNAAKMDELKLKKLSQKNVEYVLKNHTIENFKNNLKKILLKILN